MFPRPPTNLTDQQAKTTAFHIRLHYLGGFDEQLLKLKKFTNTKLSLDELKEIIRNYADFLDNCQGYQEI